MTITNRRDAGYTIISRFEESFRNDIIEKLEAKSGDVMLSIPQGVILKANSREGFLFHDDFGDFMEQIDFPDLMEICLFKDNYGVIISDHINKEDFKSNMSELYTLRCKIAHVKGFFTSIDLDKLKELTQETSLFFKDNYFRNLIEKIEKNPEEVIIKIPNDFIQDFLEQSGITHNLPIPDYEYEGGFVGRDDDRKKITQYLLSDKFPVVTISGAGGVGKTSLALKVVHDLTYQASKKPFDSIVWLSAKENKLSSLGIEDIEPTLKSFEELLDTFIELFGFENEIKVGSIEEKESLTNSIIELNDRILVMVDNLETITDERIINFIIDAPINVKFLVTSRKGIGQIERRYDLKQLKAKEAVYLFRQLARDKQLTSLITLEDAVIKKYVHKVSYYPLAIKWVLGQVARGKNINKVIDSIHFDESDISKFCFEQIFNTISSESRKLLYALSLNQDPPTASILQHTCGFEEHRFDDAIEELILVSLVIPEQFQNEHSEIATRYELLPLTRGFTRQQLNKDPETRESLKKRISEIEQTVSASERAKKEYRHSLYNFGAHTDEEKIATIMAQNAFQKYQSGHYELAVEEYRKAIKLAPTFAPLYRNWGVMESYEDHLHEATSLLQKAAELDSTDSQVFLLWGNIYRKNSKFNEAHEKYEKAFDLAPEDPIILSALGQTKGRMGNYQEAHELLNKSLVIDPDFKSVKHEIINRTSIAENLISWGDYLLRDKDPRSAEAKYLESIEICQETLALNIRDKKVYSTLTKAHLRAGRVAFQLDKPNRAIACLKSVVNSKERTFKHGILRLSALIDLANYFMNANHLKESRSYLNVIEKEFRGSVILKEPKFSSLQDNLKVLKSKLDLENLASGSITSVNLAHDYLIIEDKTDGKTYIGSSNDFIPKLVELNHELAGLTVQFSKVTKRKPGGESKRVAKLIRITGANKH
ncbi:MAG: tetratricopeptide repeat protein [Marinoscillum sp.]